MRYHLVLQGEDSGVSDTAREPAGVPSPARAALRLGGKRDYLELRPHLRRVYLASTNPDAVLPSLGEVGFALDGGPAVQLGGHTYSFIVNDFGPESVDGWLRDVLGRELETTAASPLDPDRRELVLDGRGIELTRLEWETLAYPHARRGRAADRADLLRDVWGHDWTGGSNVVEVVVSALRRKLGAARARCRRCAASATASTRSEIHPPGMRPAHPGGVQIGAMSDPTRPAGPPPVSGWALGGVAFAACVLTITGAFQIITGLVAVFDDNFFVVAQNYTFDVDTTVWGILHLLLGLLVMFTGFGLFSRAAWAGVTAIMLASLSAVLNFFFIPYYPFWAIVVIALDIWVIWALTRPGAIET